MPQRHTDLAQSLGGGHFKLSDKLRLCPSAPRLCLFYSLSFVSDNGFLKPCLCSRCFLEVYALESPLQRFLVKSMFSTLFNIIPIVQTWVQCYNALFFNVSCGSHYHVCPLSESALAPSFPRFSGLGLATFLFPEVSACFQQY